MPFTAHKDFLASYDRALMVLQGKASIFEYDQPLSILMQAVNLKIFSPLLPADKLPLEEEYTWPYTTIIPKSPITNRVIFLFKLPYLLFELGTLFLLLKLVAIPKGKKYLDQKGVLFTKLWMLNPLLIFTFYIYGRYDSFTFFVLAAALLALAKKKELFAATLLGVSLIFRVYPVLLVPVFLLSVGSSWKERLKHFLVILMPYAGWLMLKQLFFTASSELSWLTGGAHQALLYSFSLTLDQGFIIYPFFLAYFTFLTWLWIRGKKAAENSALDFSRGSLIVVFLFLALSVFLPNYPVWVFPFLILFIVQSEKLRKLHYLQIVAFLMILPFWNNPLFLRLLTPISERAFLDFPVRGLVSLIYPAQKVIDLGRTLFTAVSLFMAYLLLKDYEE